MHPPHCARHKRLGRHCGFARGEIDPIGDETELRGEFLSGKMSQGQAVCGHRAVVTFRVSSEILGVISSLSYLESGRNSFRIAWRRSTTRN